MSSSHSSTVALKQQVFAQHRKGRKTKGMPKSSTVAAYTGVFLLVISLVAVGYRPPQSYDELANATGVSSAVTPPPVVSSSAPSVDEMVAVNLAANLAETTDMPVAPILANLSVTMTQKDDLSQSDDTLLSKAQIVQPTSSSRGMKTYVTKASDTVDLVAAQYGLRNETIKWANNLTSDLLEPNKSLIIPSTDGVVYTVKDGDTLESIAEKYKSDTARIILFNDLELSNISTGLQIIVPDGQLPETERPGYVAPRQVTTSQSFNYGYSYASYTGNGSFMYVNSAGTSGGNKNYYGQCTWYAWERRQAIGRPLPGMVLGNAYSWASTLGSAGYLVNHTPAVGAVLQTSSGGGGYGHVAVVESISANGDVTVSEMNFIGNNVVSSRTIPAGSAASFNYVH
ncbi:MAG: CHAP domain-containing protein [Candidatus Saccharimonadales bacterium]